MKALKEFDYNLWTTEEDGGKKYFVGVKATGEVTEMSGTLQLYITGDCEEQELSIDGSVVTAL